MEYYVVTAEFTVMAASQEAAIAFINDFDVPTGEENQDLPHVVEVTKALPGRLDQQK